MPYCTSLPRTCAASRGQNHASSCYPSLNSSRRVPKCACVQSHQELIVPSHWCVSQLNRRRFSDGLRGFWPSRGAPLTFADFQLKSSVPCLSPSFTRGSLLTTFMPSALYHSDGHARSPYRSSLSFLADACVACRALAQIFERASPRASYPSTVNDWLAVTGE